MEQSSSDTQSTDDRSRQLVVVTDGPSSVTACGRPASAFLAQLMACERRIGIYRVARRTSPTAAAAAYTATERRVTTL